MVENDIAHAHPDPTSLHALDWTARSAWIALRLCHGRLIELKDKFTWLRLRHRHDRMHSDAQRRAAESQSLSGGGHLCLLRIAKLGASAG